MIRRTLAMSSMAAALAAPAAAAPTWAPFSSAAIHPGVQTFTSGIQCTSSFVFYDRANVYLGQAAHCARTGGMFETNGCVTRLLPVGIPVRIDGARWPGALVYSSWWTMRQLRERDQVACGANDFALVRIDPRDVARVNPSLPAWGGPTGLNTTGTRAGEAVFSYGNSNLRRRLVSLKPKQGISLGDTGGGWLHLVVTNTPSLGGDSGSAFLDRSGRALGVLSTVVGVADLNHALAYMKAHTPFDVTLALGTQPFQAPTAKGRDSSR